MGRWRIYRLPILFCAAAALELGRAQFSTPEFEERANRAAERVLESRYPELPRSIYQRGLRALQERDLHLAKRSFERALSADYYTNESLLHNYALLLIALREPAPEIDRAAELWRKHFPQSKNPDPRRYIEAAPTRAVSATQWR